MNTETGTVAVAQILSAEAEMVRGLLFGRMGLGVLLSVLVILFVQYVLRRGVRRWGRVTGHEDISDVVVLGLRLVAYTLVLGVVGRAAFRAAPVLAAIVLALGAAGLAFGIGTRAQGWWVGWSLILRGRVRRGDHLEVGATRGVVEHLGLLRLVLRTDAGARVMLSLRDLAEGRLAASTPDRSFVVEIVVPLPHPVDAATLQRARRVAGLCPYRSWSAPPAVVAEGERAVRVRLNTWSARAGAAAESYLRDALGDRG